MRASVKRLVVNPVVSDNLKGADSEHSFIILLVKVPEGIETSNLYSLNSAVGQPTPYIYIPGL